MSHLTNPNGFAAALDGGARIDRDLAPRCGNADGYFWFVARKKRDIVRRRGEDIAGAELGRVVNLAATAATRP